MCDVRLIGVRLVSTYVQKLGFSGTPDISRIFKLAPFVSCAKFCISTKITNTQWQMFSQMIGCSFKN